MAETRYEVWYKGHISAPGLCDGFVKAYLLEISSGHNLPMGIQKGELPGDKQGARAVFIEREDVLIIEAKTELEKALRIH